MPELTADQNAKNLAAVKAAQARKPGAPPVTGPVHVASAQAGTKTYPGPAHVQCAACNKEYFLPTSCTCGAQFESQFNDSVAG